MQLIRPVILKLERMKMQMSKACDPSGMRFRRLFYFMCKNTDIYDHKACSKKIIEERQVSVMDAGGSYDSKKYTDQKKLNKERK